MPRYNFHSEMEKVKKDPKNYRLPEDINAPVIAYFEKSGCKAVVDEIKKAQDNLQYKTIDVLRKDIPSAKVTIQIDCGMVDGYKKCEVKEEGNWAIICTTTVKNKNLDKTKPKKVVSNG